MVLLKTLGVLSLSTAIVTVIYLIIELLTEGEDSFIFRMSKKFASKISGKEKRDRLKEKNTLFKCSNSNCNRLFRLYQARLYKSRKGESACPHCEIDIAYSSRLGQSHSFHGFRSVSVEDSWMVTHPDCPRINQKELKNLDETIEQLKKAQKEKEEMERFEEYNKISVDLKWIENIQK